MVKITEVESGSLADRAGILVGDTLLSINENEICDVLDYRFYLTERTVTLLLGRGDGELSVSIKKGEYDDIGLGFETPLMDKKHSCKNGCIFCFIDQNPEGLRESLYFKDDDSRLSFIHGNYVTLTNMTDKDVARIIKMRMSPINISIHTTNPELRVKMMKNKRAGEVLRYLSDFKDAGLSMCGQIVLCRGVNDGEELLRTMRELSEYFPELSSVSVVPAGLTRFRDKLYPLSDFTEREAGEIIDLIDKVGEEMQRSHGSRLFFAADELYLKAKREIPPADYYEGYPQIENGVGMLRSLIEDFDGELGGSEIERGLSIKPRTVSIATGVAAYPTIVALCEKIERILPNLQINVYKIINNFFGKSITVAGLLTGRDIKEQLLCKALGEELLIPEAALRHGEEVFLCDMTVSELSTSLGVKVTPVGDGCDLFVKLLSTEK